VPEEQGRSTPALWTPDSYGTTCDGAGQGSRRRRLRLGRGDARWGEGETRQERDETRRDEGETRQERGETRRDERKGDKRGQEEETRLWFMNTEVV